MQKPGATVQRACWCGNRTLEPFSPDYGLCKTCGTLVSQAGLADAGYLVENDDTDFYGKKYWLEHQSQDLGLPQIRQRVRMDLPQRCVYWLRHLLGYKLPPCKVLELGCAHGGFVALMRWAGFDATGLELSPWVAEQARQLFQVPMLVGPVDQQTLEPGSLDVVIAHDVMEHLPDPETTLRQAARLLKPDGLLIIQMPEYPEGTRYQDLVTYEDRFLAHTKEPDEHLYLYSKRAARAILARLGLNHVEFHRPYFDYDMYFVAARSKPARRDPAAVTACLEATAPGRFVLALLDKSDEAQRSTALLQESEQDRAARLEALQSLEAKVLEERRLHQAQLLELHRLLGESDKDRAARLEAIHQLEGLVHETEAMQRQLRADLAVSDADRNARLQVIMQQEKLAEVQQATIKAQRQALHFLQATCLTPRLGRWTSMARKLAKKIAKTLAPMALQRRLRARFAKKESGTLSR
jgi:SAM-dependent methyltransferase